MLTPKEKFVAVSNEPFNSLHFSFIAENSSYQPVVPTTIGIPLFKHLDTNKVISGILIKDIGCIKYFNKDLIFSISKEGKFLNVPTLGMNLFNSEFSKMEISENDAELFCQHIISINDKSPDLETNYINMLFELDAQLLDTSN